MPIPRVHDLTEAFRLTPWTGDQAQDERLFPEWIRQILGGVHVHYLTNDDVNPVHDRNGERRGKGKLLILPRSATIKFGKFETGLIKRRSQDAEHMHRRVPGTVAPFDAAPRTFGECLRLGLVLDLTGRRMLEVRATEDHLRTQIRRFLQEQSLPVQDHRGDYRILTEPAPADIVLKLSDWARDEFQAIVDRLSSGPPTQA